MSEIDQQFIEYVVKSLVGKPEAVHIDRRIDEKGVLLELTVDPDDLGRVIGKRGATAQSLRTLLRALGTKNDARYNLKIIDNGPLSGRSDDRPAKVSDDTADDKTGGTDTDDKADDKATDDKADDTAAAVEEEPAQPEPAEEAPKADADAANSQDEAETSDRLAQTRQELADLDDLDL